MARPLRIEFPGALYHVTARGDRQEPIYEDDQDREAFLTLLAEVIERFNWLCHAYCLMTNHYHLVVVQEVGSGLTLDTLFHRFHGEIRHPWSRIRTPIH